MNINLSNGNVKFSVNDNSQTHILTEYLNTVIDIFTAEELLNQDYYVNHHQDSVREMIAALLADSENKGNCRSNRVCQNFNRLKNDICWRIDNQTVRTKNRTNFRIRRYHKRVE